MYWTSEIKSRRLLKRFLYYGCVHLSTFLPVLITAFTDILNGEFGRSAYDLPFNVVVPFNMESVFGWLITWLYQFIACSLYLVQMITTTACFIGFCQYIMAMCAHFDLLIDSIRSDSKEIHAENNTQIQRQMWLNVKAKLQQAIEMHIDIYE